MYVYVYTHMYVHLHMYTRAYIYKKSPSIIWNIWVPPALSADISNIEIYCFKLLIKVDVCPSLTN